MKKAFTKKRIKTPSSKKINIFIGIFIFFFIFLITAIVFLMPREPRKTGIGTLKTDYVEVEVTCGQYTAPFAITTPGINYVRFFSKDVAGNIEGVKWKAITIVTNQPPTADIGCSATNCSPGGCANWIAYRPTADPNPCYFILLNNSTDPDGQDDIVKSIWYFNGLEKSRCESPGWPCNYTLQVTDVAGGYTVELYVEDSQGASDSTTQSLTIRNDVFAGLMCSKDNLNWQTCESLMGITEGETLYLKDDPSLSEYSTHSDGATSITSRTWEQNGVVFAPGGGFGNNETNPSVALAGSTIRLTVTDDAPRSDYEEHTIGVALPLPKWKEIPPSF